LSHLQPSAIATTGDAPAVHENFEDTLMTALASQKPKVNVQVEPEIGAQTERGLAERLEQETLEQPEQKSAERSEPGCAENSGCRVAEDSEQKTIEVGQAKTARNKHFSLKKVAFSIAGVLLSAVALLVWKHFATYQETDDAYVTAHISPLSSRIEDNVEQVLIDDNEHVKKGQLIIVLDPRDFERKVDEARAQLDRVKEEARVSHGNVSLAAMKAQASKLHASGDFSSTTSAIAKATTSISEVRFALQEQEQVYRQKEAELTRAEADYQRYYKLEKQGAVTTSQRDAARRDFDVAQATCDATKRQIEVQRTLIQEARHQLEIAKAQNVQSQGSEHEAQASEIQTDVNRMQTGVSSAAIKEAESKLRTALLQLSYTRIYAPVTGRVGRKTVEVGQRVQPGGRLLTLTEDELWIVANFKENQLERIKKGQGVEIKIDALPHTTFAGFVDSFSPGSGAQFTLLPPDNATGNFTKIVQRVPVKIHFTSPVDTYLDKLVPGLSAVVSVDVSK
jgi:membrane fusion protein, multidrug efflux system